MSGTPAITNQFPGTVPALLAWADGDTERLGDLVTTFCADAPSLVRSLSRDIAIHNGHAVRQKAQKLHGSLRHFGVPQLRTAAATLEDLGRSKDLGLAIPLIEEMDAALKRFCAYLAKKPWFRY